MRLTDDERYEVYPVFTADGAHIVYVRLNEDWTDHEIVVMTANGEFVNIVAEDVDFFDYHYGRKFGYPLVTPDAGDRALSVSSQRLDQLLARFR